MNISIDLKTPEAINKTSVLQQTAYWSEVKRKQGIKSCAFDVKASSSELYNIQKDHSVVTDDFLVLLQNIGDGLQIAYVPYGPTLEPAEDARGDFLETLSESLKPYLGKGCIALRYDLCWESFWANEGDLYNENNEWEGPPSLKSQEFRFNFNTHNWNLKKANSNILPADTIFINLKKSEEELLSTMKPKTRYNIRLAKRKGVNVSVFNTGNIDVWYELYKETCIRNGIYLHDINYFKTVLKTNAGFTNSPGETELLIADVQGTPVAAMFLAFSGSRATYLYGASSGSRRNFMGTYALQWEAICRSRRLGYTEYDMFGISPNPNPSHPMYGLYCFKKGFGGSVYHRMGCWDYPLDLKNYELFRSSEINSTGYHLNG